jgi:hypothetical protein
LFNLILNFIILLNLDSNQFLKFETNENSDNKNNKNEADLNLYKYDTLPVCYNTQNLEASYKFDSIENIKNLTNKEIVHESYFISI